MSTDTVHALEAKRDCRRYVWASVAAWFINFFIIPMFLYPMGVKSHYTLEGTILAGAAGMAGSYGFLGCPRRPVVLKLGTALVCVFSVVVAIDAVIQFFRFGRTT